MGRMGSAVSRTYVLVSSRVRKHPVRWVGLLLVAVATLLIGVVGGSQAAEPWSVQVIGTSGGPDDLAVDEMTYADAKSALTTASGAGTPVTLPVAPTGFPGVTTDDASLDLADDAFTLTVSGPTDLLGVDAEVMMVAVWADADTDDAPSVTVAFRTGAASLRDFAPALDAVEVGLSKTWTAFRKDPADTSTLAVGDLPQAGQDFFADGDDASDDDLDIGQGVAFRALVDGDSAGLGDALGRVGVDYARLDGTLSTSDAVLDENAPASPTGFALTATLGLQNPDSMPDWLALDSPWTLDLARTSGGDLTVGLEGGATVSLGDAPVSGTASVAVTMSDGSLSLDLGIEIDTVEAPFGADWLTLESAAVEASISADGVSGSLSAEVTVGTAPDALTGTVEVALAKSAGALTATLDAALTGTISAKDLADLVGADVSDLPDDVDVSLSDLALHVAVAPQALTVSATGTADVELGGTTVGATMLVRKSPDGLVVAARPTGQLSLSDLVGTVSPDPTLPDLSVVVSTADVETPSADLDGPTRAYFAGVMCPDGEPDCDFDLELDTGVSLAAAIELPEAITGALSEIGLDATDPLQVTGLIPAFGGTTTSLTVELPGLSSTGDGEYVRGAGLDLQIRKAGSTVTFGLKGSLTLGIPRVESDDCPSGIFIGGGTQCIDEVEFSLTAQFAFDGTSAAFELVGGLASAADEGWQKPFGIPYLTLHEAKLKLGVETGPQTKVTIGFLGSLVVGQTDISISASVGVTPNSPYLDFEGFTGSSKNGLSMRQLGKLYTDVSGQTIPESVIPPVGIRNLFLSIGHVDDADLCLRAGFYLSGDLYLDKGLPSGTVEPGCLSPGGDEPTVTDQCEEDEDCIASVLIDVQTGKGGGVPSVNAQGYITGWNAGPLTFDPTIVKLNLNSSGARVFIKAGATLLDPIEYYSTGSSSSVWASGSVTLDIGTQRLLVKGDVVIADIIEAGVQGSGKFDLTDPDFELSVYLRAAFLDDIAEGIDEAIRAVNATADEFAKAFSSQNMETVFSEIRNAFDELGNPGSATWQTLSSGYFDFRKEIDKANDTLQFWGFGRPIPVNQLLDLALFGIVTPDIPALEICLFGGCATIIPAINIPDIPGLCSYVPGLKGSAICTGPKSQVDEQLRAQYAAPVIKEEVVDAGLTLPQGVSVDTLVSKFAALEPASTPANRSARAVATGGTEVTCAVSQVSYPEGEVSDTTFDVATMGTVVTITGDQPEDLATDGEVSPAAADEAEQDTFDALLTTSDEGGCTGSAPPPGPTKVLSLSLDKSLADEGSTLVASGRSVGGTVGEAVTVRWGDGTTSSTTLSSTKTWTASHVYADDAGPGTATTYTVRAEAVEHDEAVRQVAVVNVAPLVTDLTLPSAPVDETDTSTVSGTVTDPGSLDTHTVLVDWGDGTVPVSVPVVDRAFSATHVYADDNPSSTDEDVVPVSVVVEDKDRASTDEVDMQTVANTPAYDLTFGPRAQVVDGDTMFTRTGRITSWRGAVSDRSRVDLLRTEISWGDGSGTDLMLTNDGSETRTIDAQHGWTQPCVYRVTAGVSDDDLGPADAVARTAVVTRATAGKGGGTSWWTRQFRALTAGRSAALTPAQATCYLSVARQVSDTFGKRVRLTSSAAARDVLTMRRATAGQTRPTPTQALIQVERAKLDRALLGALLDFVHGKHAWNEPVVRMPRRGFVRFGQLVELADAAHTGGSVDRMVRLRKALGRI